MPPEEVPIPGLHNVENVMAAAAAADIAGDLQGRHRRRREDIPGGGAPAGVCAPRSAACDFYNDSKATSVDATMKALDSFAGRPVGDPRRQGQGQRLHGAARPAAAQGARGAADRRGGGKNRRAARRRGPELIRAERWSARCAEPGRARGPAIRCCWPRPAPASISFRVTSIADGSSRDLVNGLRIKQWRSGLRRTGFSSARWS